MRLEKARKGGFNEETFNSLQRTNLGKTAKKETLISKVFFFALLKLPSGFFDEKWNLQKQNWLLQTWTQKFFAICFAFAEKVKVLQSQTSAILQKK